jgi:hypothetical protein
LAPTPLRSIPNRKVEAREAKRKSGVVSPGAQLVVTRMLVCARADAITQNIEVADRGADLVSSPPGTPCVQ